MKDILCYIAEEMEVETGKDYDDIFSELMEGKHGTLAELIERYPETKVMIRRYEA